MKACPLCFFMAGLMVFSSGCVSQREMAQTKRQVENLEEQSLSIHERLQVAQEDLRDQDLRLQFLEFEALRRGEPIAPRRDMSQPDPAALFVDPDPARRGQPFGSLDRQSVRQGTRPSGQQASQGGSPAKESSPQISPADSQARAEAQAAGRSSSDFRGPAQPLDLPASPASTATQAGSGSAVDTALAEVPPVDLRRGSENMTLPPESSSSLETDGTAVALATGSPTANPLPGQSEQNAYDSALHLYRTGRFAQAESSFQTFLQNYPNSPLVANALYWRGETYYARAQYADAIFSFKDVQTRFPQNQKTPDSLLKTAMSYQKLGDTANASLHLSVLYEDWPNSEATQRAKRMGLRP